MSGATVMTSATSPLRVDFVEGLSPPGRLGMTLAPGKRDAHGAVVWERDLDADLARLAGEYRTSLLVSLLEEHELELLGIAGLVPSARARGIEVERFPIPDGAVPGPGPELAELVARIGARRAAGGTVVVHCRAGLGRTGLVVACSLVSLSGASAAEAIQAVRTARPGTIETHEQEEWVRRWASARPY